MDVQEVLAKARVISALRCAQPLAGGSVPVSFVLPAGSVRDAVELTAAGDAALALKYPIVRNSDAHNLAKVGTVFNEFDVDSLTVASLRSCLWNKPSA